MRRRPVRASIWLVALALITWTGLSAATPYHAVPSVTASASAAQGGQLTPIDVPAGAEGLGAAWYAVSAPDGRQLLLAVFDPRPTRNLPAPALLVLHGSHGFAAEYVQIAHDLAEQTGFVTAAGCWFEGAGPDADTSAVTTLACPGGPEFVGATAGAWPTVRTLGEAVRGYASTDRLGVFGHGRGAEVALQLASSGDRSDTPVQAVVSSSGVYTALPRSPDYDTPTPLSLAETLSAPVLLLHGLGDTETRASNATLYYQRVRSLGRPAQCILYPGAAQNAILHASPDDAQDHLVFQDGVRRSAAFFTGAFSESVSLQSVDCVPAF